MRTPQDVIAQIREDVMLFQHNLQQKMIALAQEGLLTEKDKTKIEYNMRASIDALSRAVQNQSYDPSFREEWILRTVKSYEDEIQKQIREIESRRYTDKRIAERIKRIVEQGFSGEPPIDRKGTTATEIAKLEKLLWEDIRGISQKHRRRSLLIESWLQEFETDVQSLLRLRLDRKRD